LNFLFQKNAFPCFPNIPPPTTILEFKLSPDDGGPKSPGGMAAEAEPEEDEEEEEEEEE
jgi:hypothetical protein